MPSTGAGRAKRARGPFHAAWLPSLLVLVLAATGNLAIAQTLGIDLLVTVVDETGVAVPAAQLTLTSPGRVLHGETNYAGKYRFAGLVAGSYQLKAEKEGFFAVLQKEVQVPQTTNVDVTLSHQREFVEQVNVTYSPPLIDPQKTTSSNTLTSREIIDLPYSVPRDFRYLLPMLPGIVQDGTGQVHVAGSDTPQTLDEMDGFNISAPGSGLLTMRVNVDALRSITVQDSRYPAEYGQGSGGVLSLATGMGDNRYRFSGTDFVPSLQNRHGWHVGTWTPRGVLSGPLKRDKAWFLIAPEAEYHRTVVTELPHGADSATDWRFGDLAKAQVNLTSANILTGSFLVNRFRSDHAGLTRFDPVETTLDLNQEASLVSLKDQAFLSNGLLIETGIAQSFFDSGARPMGTAIYSITPNGTRGNFFEASRGRSSRLEAIANLIVPPAHWRGRHEFSVGVDLDRLTFHQSFDRHPFLIIRNNGTLSRRVTFGPSPPYSRNNFEAAVYFEDRWSLSDHLLIEPGLRVDRDQVVRDVVLSPRLASTYLLRRRGETKLVGGVGLYYDRTNLDLVNLPLGGERTDFFYDPTGQMVVRPPVVTSFEAARGLDEPHSINWSAGVERKLPGALYTRVEFLEKRQRAGLAYANSCVTANGCFDGLYTLENIRRDRYDSAQISVRKSFKGDHLIFASYARSSARSNAVLEFNLENPIFAPQEPGPLAWNTPSRFISWGFLPLVHQYDLAYTLDWHSGFPFSAVNQDQQLVGSPGSRTFPTYFSLDLAVEKRIRLFGYEWAVRAGFNDITNRHNPFAVDNNVDSPHFLAYSAIQGRSLTARIRLLGRK